jgi:hypothetical protein
MTTRTMTAISARFLIALTLAGASGCATGEELDDPGQDEVAQLEDALIRNGGSPRASYTCSNGTCTCDKSIENDCANMSGVCTDATVDALINCINGWLTTHCTCTKAFVAPQPKSPYVQPTGGFTLMNAR